MLARAINKVVRVSKQRLRRAGARASGDIKRLEISSDPKHAAIGRALSDTLRDVHSEAEASAMREVERRRAELLANKREIPKVDFGAGSYRDPADATDSLQGIRSTASVSSIARASKPKFWATMLFHLMRRLKPTSAVELGTCVGISAAYQGYAMQMNDRGRLLTLEGSPETARIATETLDGLGLTNCEVIVGSFHETLEDALLRASKIDYFFNDGHHDRDAVLKYFEQAKPHLTDDAVVVFDDISWSAGMREAWETIERDPLVALSVDLHDMGIVVLGPRKGTGRTLKIPL